MIEPDVVKAMRAKLSAEHRPVESGWVSFRSFTIPPDLDEDLTLLRLCFFSGATYVFANIMEKLQQSDDALKGEALAFCQCLQRELGDFCDENDCPDD